jgi:hypothetical protein
MTVGAVLDMPSPDQLTPPAWQILSLPQTAPLGVPLQFASLVHF